MTAMQFDISKLVNGLGEVTKKIAEARNRGLSVAGEHVLGVSNKQVPLEEGDLARSGAVSQDETTGKTAISYDTPYAVRQHEDMALKHDAGRNAKFLERAINSEGDKIAEIVATAMRGAMK